PHRGAVRGPHRGIGQPSRAPRARRHVRRAASTSIRRGMTAPLRVLHTEASLGWGGQEIRVLTEARGVARRGHAVTLAAPAEARIYQEASRYGVNAIALPI